MSKPALDFDAALATARTTGKTMKVDEIIANLPDDQRPKVAAALRDPTVSDARIAHALCRMGHECSMGAVRNWRIKNVR